MSNVETLTIDGNPGAAKRDEGDWEGHTSTLTVERFIYHVESATEAQIEIAITGFDGEETQTSVELTYDDLLALQKQIEAIIAAVVEDDRVPVTLDPGSEPDCSFPDGDEAACAAHGGRLAYVADTDPVCDKSPLYEPDDE